jgi:WD40 repeat protein
MVRKFESGGEDGKIKVWNLSSGQLLNTINAHSATVNALKFSPDGKYLLSASADAKWYIYGMFRHWGMVKDVQWDITEENLHQLIFP